MPTTFGLAEASAALMSAGSNISPQGRSIRVTLAPGPSGHVGHPPAEHAVDAHDHRIARLDQVDHRRFHAGRAGAADGEGHPVLRAQARDRSICCMPSISAR